MADPKTIQDVLVEYKQGLFARGETPHRLLGALLDRDIDLELSRLPAEILDDVLWLLRDAYAPIIGHETAEYSLIEGVTIIPGREEAYGIDLARREEHFRNVQLPHIQRWFCDHPLPPREQFPTEIVAGLLARVKADREVVGRALTKEQSRDRHARRRRDELVELEIALEAALRRASLAAVGSQEQAMAWEGVERSIHVILTRTDLTPDETRLAADAHVRRATRAVPTDVLGGRPTTG
jgi:hypothetical protein